MKRSTISKSLRFDIFARDAFTCRYCGRRSDEVKLELDHVIPVSKGGTNDRDNLATSCEDCNAGKSAKDAKPPPEGDNARLARLQMLKEQRETAKAALDFVKARKKFRQTVVNAWCEITGRDSVDDGTIRVVAGYVEKYGMEVVIRWIEKAHYKVGYDDRRMGRYISGIRRKQDEGEG